jgi:hypothetical protein
MSTAVHKLQLLLFPSKESQASQLACLCHPSYRTSCSLSTPLQPLLKSRQACSSLTLLVHSLCETHFPLLSCSRRKCTLHSEGSAGLPFTSARVATSLSRPAFTLRVYHNMLCISLTYSTLTCPHTECLSYPLTQASPTTHAQRTLVKRALRIHL